MRWGIVSDVMTVGKEVSIWASVVGEDSSRVSFSGILEMRLDEGLKDCGLGEAVDWTWA